MSFFKNKFVAIVIAVFVVIASTLLSTNIRFGKECRAVTDGFYEGVEYNGYQQKSMATHLKNICAYVDGLVTIARNYDLDTAEAEAASDSVKSLLSGETKHISYVSAAYSELIKASNALQAQLARTELEERDASGVAEYSASITGAQSAMENAGYNESVREFRRKNDHFPTRLFASLAGVSWPENFA